MLGVHEDALADEGDSIPSAHQLYECYGINLLAWVGYLWFRMLQK
jgi:hypothetical protein